MNIIDSRNGDEALIEITSNSLAGDDATELKTKTTDFIDAGVSKIRLDLSKPEYIDSSGIGKLLYISKKIEKINGEFSIIKINSTLYDFLESLAITKVINIAKPS